jgi:hypothetical protein
MAGVGIVGDIDMFGDELAAGSIAFAKPKSSTFTVPSDRTLMFTGLRSRRNDHLLVGGYERVRDLLRDRERPMGIAPRAMRCDKSSTSTSSITSAVMPVLSSRP